MLDSPSSRRKADTAQDPPTVGGHRNSYFVAQPRFADPRRPQQRYQMRAPLGDRLPPEGLDQFELTSPSDQRVPRARPFGRRQRRSHREPGLQWLGLTLGFDRIERS
jgi:hypothetical protein